MKKVVVCYKWLLDDADIRVNGNRTLDTSKAKCKINEYDRNGIEAGVQLKKAGASALIGVTCGQSTDASTKDALSRGLDSVTYLNSAALNEGNDRATAKTLAGMIKSIGDVDVIICSESSSDEYSQQVAPRVASLLGIPCVSYVNEIKVAGDTLQVSRKLDDGVEHVEVQCPVLISVVPEINEAPIPSMKQILGAKKKPANKVDLAGIGVSEADIAPLVTIVSTLAPEVKRKKQRMNPEGTSVADAAAALVKQLKADGIL